MKKRCIAVILMVVMMATAFPPQQTYAASWKLIEDGGCYYYIDESTGQDDWFDGCVYWNGKNYVCALGWQKIDNKWYYFDPGNNAAVTDTLYEIGNNYFAFTEEGVMRTGWIKDEWDGNVTWFYAKGNGALATGWTKIGGKWYYFDEIYPYMYADMFYDDGENAYLLTSSGAMGTGWVQSDAANWWGEKQWFYADDKGVLKKGWQKIGEKWYYFDPYEYYMFANDSYYVGNKIYLFNPSGSLVSKAGWVKLGDYWYYANADGTPNVGWKKINGNYYYLIPDWGIMENSAIVIGGVLYKFNSNGVYTGKVTKAGWQRFGGVWYYVKSDGSAATEWEKINGKWYYFDEYGGMMTGPVMTSVGNTYYFDASGAMVTKAGWRSVGYEGGYTEWYYVDANGKCRTGWQKINGKWYYFDLDSAFMYADSEYEIDGNYYTFDENGVWVG